MSWFIIIRWLHIFAAASWFGEVMTINFVLVPALGKLEQQERARFMSVVFPRIFRLASVLSLLTVASGTGLFVMRYGGNWSVVWHAPITTLLAIGALMGLALTLFHFVMEPRLSKLIRVAEAQGDLETTALIHSRLRLIPRAGLGVIASIVLLMMAGARGF
ncbi:MAG: hypothetical protein OXU20_15375 [Myxococcales bacterium]|nr:hypothetical protein [Myxococcales bacterium]